MKWKSIVAALRKKGYKGDEDSLTQVKHFVNETGVNLETRDGESIDLDAAYELRGKTVYIDADDEDVKMGRRKMADEDEEEKKAADEDEDDEAAKTFARAVIKGLRDQADVNGKSLAISGVRDRFEDDPLRGYKTGGQFFRDVMLAARGQTSDRLIKCQKSLGVRGIDTKAAATTFSSEGVGADGGFAVLPDMQAQITNLIFGEDSLMARTRQEGTSSNELVIPVNEVTPWNTTDGPQANPTAEGTAATQSKLKIRQMRTRVDKLMTLVPVTDELMEDQVALGSFLPEAAGNNLSFQADEQIIRGTGAGQAVGILTSSAKVSVSKETGQTADTIEYDNITKMYSRMYAPYLSGSVWLAHQSIMPQLFSLGVAVGTGGLPAYMPPNGLSSSPYGTLLGLPVIYTEHTNELGDEGDLILWNPKQYLTATKGGVKQDASIHLFFDAAETAFRWILRFGGQPFLSTAISPRDGSATYSSIVTLAARA